MVKITWVNEKVSIFLLKLSTVCKCRFHTLLHPMRLIWSLVRDVHVDSSNSLVRGICNSLDSAEELKHDYKCNNNDNDNDNDNNNYDNNDNTNMKGALQYDITLQTQFLSLTDNVHVCYCNKC